MLAKPSTRIGSSAATPIRIASGPCFDDVIPTPVRVQPETVRPPSNFYDFEFAQSGRKATVQRLVPWTVSPRLPQTTAAIMSWCSLLQTAHLRPAQLQ